MIKREIQKEIQEHILNNKVLILKAPAFTQRTKLVMESFPKHTQQLLFDFSDKKTQKQFKDFSPENFKSRVGSSKCIVFREAQLLSNLQQLIELVLFEENDLTLVCICSYDPPLDDLLTEALAQNNLILSFQAPGFKEIANQLGLIKVEKNLEERLIFGNYPAVLENPENAAALLQKITDQIAGYPFSKSERINKKDKLKKMLQYIAFHIGEQLSYNQIGTKSGLDNETVERYVTMLEKAFILFRLPVYSTNQRYELGKTHCFYFFDNGIRNSFIQNFNEPEIRNDLDQLWKNWVISERMKKLRQSKTEKNPCFWVTHTKQQMDYMEVGQKEMKAYQLIWDKSDKFRVPAMFLKYYPKALTYKINRSSYWSFLSKD
ncbi:MAG: hypothetical protein K0R65_2477 [Crocinitomicaceae bacterium]|jgi:predicted AAA+ superfamily ATPase|nr:hypothetical protein [Crocinitomicaceae bacterium]